MFESRMKGTYLKLLLFKIFKRRVILKNYVFSSGHECGRIFRFRIDGTKEKKTHRRQYKNVFLPVTSMRHIHS